MLHRQLPDDHFDRKEFISDGRSLRLFDHTSIALQVSAVAVGLQWVGSRERLAV